MLDAGYWMLDKNHHLTTSPVHQFTPAPPKK
jgi:hypothetical protein